MESWAVVVVVLTAASRVLTTPFINKLPLGQEYPTKNSYRQPSTIEEVSTDKAEQTVPEIASTSSRNTQSSMANATLLIPETGELAALKAPFKPEPVSPVEETSEKYNSDNCSLNKPEVSTDKTCLNSDAENSATNEPSQFEPQDTVVAPTESDTALGNETAVIIPKTNELTKNEGKVDYSGAQVWKINTNRTGVRAVIMILKSRNLVSTWGHDHTSADILIRHDAIENVTRILKKKNILHEVIIEDLQKRIDEENPPLSPDEMEPTDKQGHRMTWKQYHRLEDIHGFMEYLAKRYPTIISTKSIGKSHECHDLKILRISDGKPTNKAVFIDGGIHAREWISTATVTYFINQFAENFDEESDGIKNTDWYFLPVVNPDGYEYTHTTDRLWRKNRKPSNLARVCSGTDLNRNFGYQWGGLGASSNPCSGTFRGRTAFSEPESKALSDFIKSSGVNFSAYLTYHSYGQYLMYPWGYSLVVPPDYKDLDEAGKIMAQAIQETGGSNYSVGSFGRLLYPASGGSVDWAKAQGIKYSYTIELSDTGRYGFILPTSYINAVAKESLAGLRALMKIIHRG